MSPRAPARVVVPSGSDMNASANKRRKRPITVTVAGERGSGKTTLISVVAHALENSGHKVAKGPYVPNATRAIADLHEQFDVTFVEQYEADTEVEGLRARNRELTERLAEFRETNIRVVEESRVVVNEAAQLRATIEELRGQVAGLSNENARLRESNVRYAKVDEDLRAANLAYAAENADLRVENHELSRTRVPPQDARRQIDMAFEEVRQAAYIEMERNRLRTQADELKQRARKLGHEGDARLDGARQRMMFALTGGTAARVAQFDPLDEKAEEQGYDVDYERPRTLLEQAADIRSAESEAYARYADESHRDFDHENDAFEKRRAQSATDRLAAANLALMGDDDFSQDRGC